MLDFRLAVLFENGQSVLVMLQSGLLGRGVGSTGVDSAGGGVDSAGGGGGSAGGGGASSWAAFYRAGRDRAQIRAGER